MGRCSYLAPLKVLARLAHMLAYRLEQQSPLDGQVLSGLLQSPPFPIAYIDHPVSLVNKTCLVPEAFEFVTPTVSAAIT